MKKRWHRYRYKNLTAVALSAVIALLLICNPVFHRLIAQLHGYGYIGAIFGGMFFVSTFTATIGAAILVTLSETLHPLEIVFLGAAGGLVSDFLIFRYIRNDNLVEEIKHFFQYFGSDKIMHLVHTKYFAWTLPVLGALIMASPLPDELGVSLMGISQMKTRDFLFLSFTMNIVQMAGIVLLSKIV